MAYKCSVEAARPVEAKQMAKMGYGTIKSIAPSKRGSKVSKPSVPRPSGKKAAMRGV